MRRLTCTYAFAGERQPVDRERMAGTYGALPYFIAKLLVDVPMSVLHAAPLSVLLHVMVGLGGPPTAGLVFYGILVLVDLNAQARAGCCCSFVTRRLLCARTATPAPLQSAAMRWSAIAAVSAMMSSAQAAQQHNVRVRVRT